VTGRGKCDGERNGMADKKGKIKTNGTREKIYFLMAHKEEV
jgi:hypothetical protein